MSNLTEWSASLEYILILFLPCLILASLTAALFSVLSGYLETFSVLKIHHLYLPIVGCKEKKEGFQHLRDREEQVYAVSTRSQAIFERIKESQHLVRRQRYISSWVLLLI
jgi:hypothetical protein